MESSKGRRKIILSLSPDPYTQDTYHEEEDTEDISGSISMTVYGAATGPNVSLGYGEQHISTDVLQNNK